MSTLVTQSNCWQRSTDERTAHDHIVVERHSRSNRLRMIFCTATSGLYQGARGRNVTVHHFKGV